jgi:hypothetical protein
VSDPKWSAHLSLGDEFVPVPSSLSVALSFCGRVLEGGALELWVTRGAMGGS